MRYRFIRDNSKEFHVENACRVMNVSTSGYYAWLRRPESDREAADRHLLAEIKRVHEDIGGAYGSRRFTGSLWPMVISVL